MYGGEKSEQNQKQACGKDNNMDYRFIFIIK